MADGPPPEPTFHGELRRMRMAAGLSISQLATLTRFSKGYISKVETGKVKTPVPDFVRITDTVLQADGKLARLSNVASHRSADPANVPQGSEPATSPSNANDEQSSSEGRSPGKLLLVADPDEIKYTLAAFRGILENTRNLGQTLNPATVVDMLKPHVAALRELAARLDGASGHETLKLAAHFADFTGWMTQETGDYVGALSWVDLTAELARSTEDDDMAAYADVRRANIALYQGDWYGTVSFAQRAAAMAQSSRVQGLAALREAQGHALAHDYEAFRRCLNRSAELLSPTAGHNIDEPIPGPTRIPDPTALAEGWSLYDLGRSEEAVKVLSRLLRATPKKRIRAWARIGARLALAHASLREIDQACALTQEILSLSPRIESATIRADMRQVSMMLSRWSFEPQVRRIMPSLSAALLSTGRGH